jgi:hypothetical protein
MHLLLLLDLLLRLLLLLLILLLLRMLLKLLVLVVALVTLGHVHFFLALLISLPISSEATFLIPNLAQSSYRRAEDPSA